MYKTRNETCFAKSLHHAPSHDADAYSTTFEDPFSYNMPVLDTITKTLNEPEPTVTSRENELLGFSLPVFNYTVLDESDERSFIAISAQLHGMFFLAESPWAAGEETASSPTELTCYRRNIFQISGSVRLSRTFRYILLEQGNRI